MLMQLFYVQVTLHHFPFINDRIKIKNTQQIISTQIYIKVFVWKDNINLFYLGMQDQFHTFNMFDAQAWYVRDYDNE